MINSSDKNKKSKSKNQKIKIYNPEGFNPANILPAELAKYENEARYFMHLIYHNRIRNKRYKYDFINLKFDYLAKVIPLRIVKPLINALIETQQVECDNTYIIGKKSKGYRLTAKLADATHREYEISKRTLVKRIKQSFESTTEEATKLPWLKWLHQNLIKVEILKEEAIACIEKLTKEGLKELKGRNGGGVTKKRRHLRQRFSCCLMAIDTLVAKNWWFAPRKGRLYTNITSLKKELRQYLRVDGQPLVEIDITNSHPLISATMLVDFYRNGKRGLTLLQNTDFIQDIEDKASYYEEVFNINKENNNLQSYKSKSFFNLNIEKEEEKVLSPNNLNVFLKNNKEEKEEGIQSFYSPNIVLSPNSKKKSPGNTIHTNTLYDLHLLLVLRLVENLPLEDDLLNYFQLVQEGRFYEFFYDKANVAAQDRKTYKKNFFKRVFCNKNHHHYQEQDLFASLFPTVWNFVQSLKEKDYKTFPLLLQRYESIIMIERVVKTIMAIKPDCFLTTIHDSILTTADNVALVEYAIKKEIEKCGLNVVTTQK